MTNITSVNHVNDDGAQTGGIVLLHLSYQWLAGYTVRHSYHTVLQLRPYWTTGNTLTLKYPFDRPLTHPVNKLYQHAIIISQRTIN